MAEVIAEVGAELRSDERYIPEVSASSTYANSASNDDDYTLSRPPTALIFYTTRGRPEAEQEARNLETSVEACGITPRMFENFSKESLLSEIDSTVDEGPSAQMVFIMASGDKGSITDSNNDHLHIQQILDVMSHSWMDGIPKILIMQSCHDLSFHPPTLVAPDPDPAILSYPRYHQTQCPEEFRVTQRDTMVVWSTSYDYDLMRNAFISKLADQIRTALSNDDIETIVKRASRAMHHSSRFIQSPSTRSTLARRFCIKKFEPSPLKHLTHVIDYSKADW